MVRNYFQSVSDRPATGAYAKILANFKNREVSVSNPVTTPAGGFLRRMVLPAPIAAAVWGVPLRKWNRLYLSGKVPLPIQISEELIGWPYFELIEAKAAEAERAKRAAEIAAYKALRASFKRPQEAS